MDPIEITIQVPLAKTLKAVERAQLVNAFVQVFKENGIQRVAVKDTYFIDRRSAVVPTEGVTSFALKLSLGGAAVQIIEGLERLIEDGRGSGKRLLITLGSESLVDSEGYLIPDDDATKLMWNARNIIQATKPKVAFRTALVYGSVMYTPWSTEPIAIIVTITNPHTVKEVVDGRLRGLIARVMVKWFCCSICMQNIEDCEHVVDEEYEGKICAAVPRDIQFLEESLTGAPVDARCKVTDLLLVGSGGSDYEWYGFQGVSVFDRLNSISVARKDKMISQEAAAKFRLYFSRHSVGRCKYRAVEKKLSPRGRVASRHKSSRV